MAAMKPPRGLSKEARQLWRTICTGWAIDEQAAVILGLALQAHDRMNEARLILKDEGLICKTLRTGALHQHPAVQIELQARQQMLQAWKQLGFDVVPPYESIGRPPGR
jgi:P27 family predicted phage terminase small subunit